MVNMINGIITKVNTFINLSFIKDTPIIFNTCFSIRILSASPRYSKFVIYIVYQ
ncbi:hypothetical protein D3C81_541610 [compost metagenome]